MQTLMCLCWALCAANERTFLHWMNMSVTIGSISAALLGAHPLTSTQQGIP